MSDTGVVIPQDSFTVPLHNPNDRHLPAVRVVQGDYQRPLKNGGNFNRSHVLLIHSAIMESQPIFRLFAQYKVTSANWKPCLTLHWQSFATRLRLCSSLPLHFSGELNWKCHKRAIQKSSLDERDSSATIHYIICPQVKDTIIFEEIGRNVT